MNPRVHDGPRGPEPFLRRSLSQTALGLGFILLCWWAASVAFASFRVVPSPMDVVRQMLNDRSALAVNAGATLREALVGFCWGNLAAVALGAVFVRYPAVERSLLRVAVACYCMPLVAVGPILVVVLPGDGPKEALAGLAVFFTTLLCTLQGLRSANPATLDVVRALGGTAGAALWKVRVPSALPSLCAGLRVAAPASLLGAVIGEYFGASQGLGVALVQAQSSFEVARSWGIALLLALLAGVAYGAASLLARLLLPWADPHATLAAGGLAGKASPRGHRLAASAGYTLWSIVLGVALWYLVLRLFRLDPYFAKTPLDVWRYLFGGPGAGQNRAELADAVRVTVLDAGVGYACGTALAVLAAVVMAAAPLVERALMPAAVFMRSVPILAVAPLVALVFGRGLLGVTAVVSAVVFFPTLVFVLSGLRGAPRAAGEVVEAMGGSPVEVIRRVRLWYGLPSLFTAARNAVPSALGGAILAEWLSTGQGAGNLLVVAYSESQFDTLWSGSVVLIALAAGSYALLGLAEEAVLGRWSGGG